jgi:hypothetical protein
MDWAVHVSKINRLRVRGRDWEAYLLALEPWDDMEADIALVEQNLDGVNYQEVWELFAARYVRPEAKGRFLKSVLAAEARVLLGISAPAPEPKPEPEPASR